MKGCRLVDFARLIVFAFLKKDIPFVEEDFARIGLFAQRLLVGCQGLVVLARLVKFIAAVDEVPGGFSTGREGRNNDANQKCDSESEVRVACCVLRVARCGFMVRLSPFSLNILNESVDFAAQLIVVLQEELYLLLIQHMSSVQEVQVKDGLIT